MIFEPTKLQGAYLVQREGKSDCRGSFTRLFCVEELGDLDVAFECMQANLSHNLRKGTLRGLHYQGAPSTEAKFIWCNRGSVWDVIVDMRPFSPTYLHHIGFELSAENGLAIYIPEMFAHGNQALADGSELVYLMGSCYSSENQCGLRYDDPVLGIKWPLPVTAISELDLKWPLIRVDHDA